MTTRRVETILDEWRTLERSLHEPMDATKRIELERVVAALAEEHRAAVNAVPQMADEPGAAQSFGVAG